MVVHDIEVNNIGSGLKYIVNLLSKTSEVSRKDRRSNEVILISPYVKGSGGTCGLRGLSCQSRIKETT